MTTKRTDCYAAIFNYIEDNVFNLLPRQFTTDWEQGLRKALLQVYPKTELKGCWYHYCMALRRKSLSLGIGKLLNRNENAAEIYRQLKCIPLLPANFIEDGFNAIKHKARFDDLLQEFEELFDYYQRNWLKLVGK